MNHTLEARTNPFSIDGLSSPPSRSALAILDCEREDLDKESVDKILARALEELRTDPDLASVYGRRIAETDLELAAELLADPTSRLLAELMDHPFHRPDLGSLDGINEALEAYFDEARGGRGPALADLSLFASLCSEILGDPPRLDVPALAIDPPEVPSAATIARALLDD